MLQMHIRSFETRYNVRYQPFRYVTSMVLTVDTDCFQLPKPYCDQWDGQFESYSGRSFEVVLHVEKNPDKYGLRLRYLANVSRLGDIHGHWSVSQEFYNEITMQMRGISTTYVTCELRAFHEGHVVKNESPLELLIDYEIDDISFPSRFNKNIYPTTKELDMRSVAFVSKTVIGRYE